MQRKPVLTDRPVALWRVVQLAERAVAAPPSAAPPRDDGRDRRPPSLRGELAVRFVLDMLALFLGIVALMLMLFASIPFIALADWLIVPLALGGLVLGLLSGSAGGRNLCGIVLLVAVANDLLRLGG